MQDKKDKEHRANLIKTGLMFIVATSIAYAFYKYDGKSFFKNHFGLFG